MFTSLIRRTILLGSILLTLGVSKVQAQCIKSITEAFTDNNLTTGTSVLTSCGSYNVIYNLTNGSGGTLSNVTITLPAALSATITGTPTVTVATLGTYTITANSIAINLTGWTNNTAITIAFNFNTACVTACSNCATVISSGGCGGSFSPANMDIETSTMSAAWQFPGGSYPGEAEINVGEVTEFVYDITNTSANSTDNIYNVTYTYTVDPTLHAIGYYYSASKFPQNGLGTAPFTIFNYPVTLPGNIAPANENFGSITIAPTDFNSVLGHNALTKIDNFYLHLIVEGIQCHVAGGSYVFAPGCGTCSNSTTLSSAVTIANGIPVIQAPPLTATGNGDNCAGGTQTLGFTIENTGTDITGTPSPTAGNARATALQLYFYTSNDLGSIDPSKFRINGTLLSSLGWTTKSWYTSFVHIVPGNTDTYLNPGGLTVYEMDFTQLPQGDASVGFNPAIFSNSLQDLEGDADPVNQAVAELPNTPGHNSFTVSVDFTYSTSCPAEFAYACADNDYFPLGVSTYYKDQCGNNMNGSYLSTGGPITNLYNYNTKAASNSTLTVAVPDMYSGITNATEAQICPGTFKQGWSGSGYEFNCPNGRHQVLINLPDGFHLNTTDPILTGGPTIYTYVGSNVPTADVNPNFSCVSATTYTLNLTTIQDLHPTLCSGDQILVDFGQTLPTGVCTPESITDIVNCFNVPIWYDCSGCANTAGWSNLTYDLQYVCDPTALPCSNCVDQLTCGNGETYTHCIGGGCLGSSNFEPSGPLIFRRLTVGWKNKSYTSHYDLCNSGNLLDPVDSVNSWTTINYDPSNPIRVDRAYPGDVVYSNLTGVLEQGTGQEWSDYSNIMFELSYSDASWIPNTFGAPTPNIFDIDPRS